MIKVETKTTVKKKVYPFNIKVQYHNINSMISITDNITNHNIVISVKEFVHIRKAHKTMVSGVINNTHYTFNEDLMILTQNNNTISIDINTFTNCLR